MPVPASLSSLRASIGAAFRLRSASMANARPKSSVPNSAWLMTVWGHAKPAAKALFATVPMAP